MKVRFRDLEKSPHLEDSAYWQKLRGQWVSVVAPPIRRGSPEWRRLGLESDQRYRGCDAEILFVLSAVEIVRLVGDSIAGMSPEDVEDSVCHQCEHELEID